MKKCFLMLMSVSVALIGTAQSTTTSSATSKFSVGPTAGYGATTISNFENSKFKAGGNFGLAMVYSAAEHFGIGLDAKYSIEGAKREVSGGIKNEIDLHYVRVPLKAIYFFNNYGSNVRPKIFLGPSFGFLSSAKVNQEGQPDSDLKPMTESFDFGVLGGVGLNYRLTSKTWLNTDFSYTHGVKEIFKEPTFKGDYSNRNLQLNVGVLFGL